MKGASSNPLSPVNQQPDGPVTVFLTWIPTQPDRAVSRNPIYVPFISVSRVNQSLFCRLWERYLQNISSPLPGAGSSNHFTFCLWFD